MDSKKATTARGSGRTTTKRVVAPSTSASSSVADSNPAVPNFTSWDSRKSHHNGTDQALEPLIKKWKSAPSRPSTVTLSDAVAHLESEKRMFSHELPKEYIAHAIGQGGVQSGYETSKALGLPEPRRDKGSAAAAFVFTRQIPNHPNVHTKLNEGQVGASTDAMLVFRPSAFSDQSQPAFFKTVDGAHHSPSIMPNQGRKGDHIQRTSDGIATNSDPIFQANQEQGLRSSVPLHHLAAIVLKTKSGDEAKAKNAFIKTLHESPRSDVLPPLEDRRRIKRKIGAAEPSKKVMTDRYKAFENRVSGQSLHDRLEEQINVKTQPGARRRQVSELVVPLSEDTRRRDLQHSIPALPDNVPIHKRTDATGRPTRLAKSLGEPNAAFFKPRK